MLSKIERVCTGIMGLDNALSGGFSKNSAVMVRGDTGTGKTLFCLQYLYKGIVDYNEPAVFLSFAESADAIHQHGSVFGWDFEKLEDDGKFAFIRYTPHEVMKVMEEGGGTIRDTIESVKAKRLVIDSLSAYMLLFENRYKANESVLNLFEILKSWNCTTLVTAETPVSVSKSSSGERLGFLTDGIINMYQIRTDHKRIRGLEVIKMRDTCHTDSVLEFTITKNGLQVYPKRYIKTKK
ncbi:MAG: hypothetical protein HZA83_02500 [Thaumarchaeota archaeon]|nr:hypothetical protein [Nitrososphaerota archaeon]